VLSGLAGGGGSSGGGNGSGGSDGGAGGDAPENSGEGAAGIFVSPVHFRFGLLGCSFGDILNASLPERNKVSSSSSSTAAASTATVVAVGVAEATQAFQIRLIVMVLVALVVEWASLGAQSVDDPHACPAFDARNAIAGADAGTSVIDTARRYPLFSFSFKKIIFHSLRTKV